MYIDHPNSYFRVTCLGYVAVPNSDVLCWIYALCEPNNAFILLAEINQSGVLEKDLDGGIIYGRRGKSLHYGGQSFDEKSRSIYASPSRSTIPTATLLVMDITLTQVVSSLEQAIGGGLIFVWGKRVAKELNLRRHIKVY